MQDRVPGPAFNPLSSEKIEHQNMMRRMKSSGLKGQLYDRNQMANNLQEMESMYEDDDEMSGMLQDMKQQASPEGQAGNEGADSEPSLLGEMKDSFGSVVNNVVGSAGKAANAVKSTFSKMTGAAAGSGEDAEL